MLPDPEHSPRDQRRAREGGARNPRGVGRLPQPIRVGLRSEADEGPPILGEWLVAPMLLLALAAGLRLALGGADSGFAISFALLLGVGICWVATRLYMSPPTHPTACPHCKRKTLVRIDPLKSTGARCMHCGWRDESANAERLGALIPLEAHFRSGVHALRLPLTPHAMRPERRFLRGEPRDRPFGDRPPQGPSGRGRRLR